MRKAKIICTIGPATDAPGVLEELILAGMDVARLNFSHGTAVDHRRRVHHLRRLSAKLDKPVAVMQDIQGPKIRLGRFQDGELMVQTGDAVTLTTRTVLGSGSTIPTPLRSLPRDVKKGDRILLDDGRVVLTVEGVRGQDVHASVLKGGLLKDHKGLNLPGASISVPTLTSKDVLDLAVGRELGVDYVALSFVRTAADIERARKHVREGTPLIAKIEKPQALDNLEAIIAASKGVMVARGDLGVELPLERLPRLQKHIVHRVNTHGRLAIVATEMLESMIHNARPTRAEVTDVANAILDGADAVMLSAETASGKYPVEAVQTMSRIVEEAERGPHVLAHPTLAHARDVSTGVAAAAVAAANQLHIDTIVAYTESGYTAQLISEFRPRASILALTPNPEVVRRVALYWGVHGRRVGRLHSTDAMLRQVRRLCRQEKVCRPGMRVVVVAGVPLNEPGRTNLMSVHTV